jgi:hypothetical protein
VRLEGDRAQRRAGALFISLFCFANVVELFRTPGVLKDSRLDFEAGKKARASRALAAILCVEFGGFGTIGWRLFVSVKAFPYVMDRDSKVET